MQKYCLYHRDTQENTLTEINNTETLTSQVHRSLNKVEGGVFHFANTYSIFHISVLYSFQLLKYPKDFRKEYCCIYPKQKQFEFKTNPKEKIGKSRE